MNYTLCAVVHDFEFKTGSAVINFIYGFEQLLYITGYGQKKFNFTTSYLSCHKENKANGAYNLSYW